MPPIIPVIIIDPANYRWVQDLDVQLPIKQELREQQSGACGSDLVAEFNYP